MSKNEKQEYFTNSRGVSVLKFAPGTKIPTREYAVEVLSKQKSKGDK
ncbi:MAG: hypothetical protein KAS32_04490 [Candidatus Peribacteraceae bacterium]|nr:hypothetical protein [Candidatus Peribacteraceae bacterium]